MPKTSSIQRNEKRKRLSAKYAKQRAELKATLANPATYAEDGHAPRTVVAGKPQPSAAEPTEPKRDRLDGAGTLARTILLTFA